MYIFVSFNIHNITCYLIYLKVIHNKKRAWEHDIAFSRMVQLIPELGSKFFVSISDNEFTSLLQKHFKKSFIALDEVHATKDIGR